MKTGKLLPSLMIWVASFTTAENIRVSPDPVTQRHENLEVFYKNQLRGEEIKWLESSSGDFLSLYQRQRTSLPQGGLLILQDHGTTPDWPRHVQKLRQFMPDVGWNTLSISLPDNATQTQPERMIEPKPDAFNYQPDNRQVIFERIQAALSFLNSEGLFNLVIVGFGASASWASEYMAEQLTEENNLGYALIIIDTKNPANEPALDINESLPKLTIPILDLLNTKSKPILWQAKLRKGSVLREGRDQYQQINDAVAGSRWTQNPDGLTRRIWGWVKTNAAGREADVEYENGL